MSIVASTVKMATDAMADLLKEEMDTMGSRVSVIVNRDERGEAIEMIGKCNHCGKDVKVYRKDLPDGTYEIHSIGMHMGECQ